MDKKKLIVIILAMVAAIIALYFSINVGEKEKPKEEVVEEPKKDDGIKEEIVVVEEKEEEEVKIENKKEIKNNIKELAKQSIFIYKDYNVDGISEKEEKLKIITTIGEEKVVLFNKKMHFTSGIEEQSVLLDAQNSYEKDSVTKEIKTTLTKENKTGTQIAKSIEGEIKVEAEEMQKTLESFYNSKGARKVVDGDYEVLRSEHVAEGDSQYKGKRISYIENRYPSEKLQKKIQEMIKKESEEVDWFMIEDYLKSNKEITLHYDEEGQLRKIETFNRYKKSVDEIEKYADLALDGIQGVVENNIYVVIPKWEEQNYIDKELFENFK